MLILGQCWSGDNAESDSGTMLEWEPCWSGDIVDFGTVLDWG